MRFYLFLHVIIFLKLNVIKHFLIYMRMYLTLKLYMKACKNTQTRAVFVIEGNTDFYVKGITCK